MFKSRLILIFCIIFSLSGCATIYNPATEKEELIFINTPTEVLLGKNVAMQISGEYKFIKEPEKVARVTAIGEKLANVSDRKDLKYHFAIIQDKDVNAFTTPGGYVYLNSGLLEKVANDDELACVLGHEIGHIAARHIAKQLQAQLGYDILINIAASKAGLSDFQKAANITYKLISLGYSREDELLADRLGAKYAYKAGYDPYAMITFLKKLKELDKGDMGPVFLRSHPYTSKRIEMMEQQIPIIIDKIKAGTAVNKAPVSISQKTSEPRKNLPARVMCSKCRRIFPGNVNYCPYDGTKLR